MLDAIVQGATVGLFHSFGVAVAPLPKAKPDSRFGFHEFTCAVAFDGAKSRGGLMLSMPQDAFALLRQVPTESHRVHDVLRELTNQLMGRLKNRLAQFQLSLHSGLPTVLDHESAERRLARSANAVAFPFRTLRGELHVIVDGTIDEGALVYSGAVSVQREGEIILFSEPGERE
jgi:hypothetical protein